MLYYPCHSVSDWSKYLECKSPIGLEGGSLVLATLLPWVVHRVKGKPLLVTAPQSSNRSCRQSSFQSSRQPRTPFGKGSRRTPKESRLGVWFGTGRHPS